MAAGRLEKREVKLEGMFRELNKWENDAKRVVGATLDAARLENKEGRTDAVAAVLASHGLAAIPPGKDVKVGDDLLHVAGVDVEAGTVRVLAGVVAAVEPDIVTLRLSDGTVLEKIPRSSLAKWDVPYLADGTEVLAPAAARTSLRRTPDQSTSSTRHPVTHWKSLVMLVWGRSARSAMVSDSGVVTLPVTSSR